MKDRRFVEESDVEQVITQNTYTTTLKELERRGKSTVKVIKAGRVLELITEAVNRVIAERSIDLAEKERERVISESNREFRRLAAERQKDEESWRNSQRRVEEDLKATVSTLRAQLDAAVSERERLAGENDRLRDALSRAAAEEEKSESENTRLVVSIEGARCEMSELRKSLDGVRLENASLKADGDRARDEANRLRDERDAARSETERVRSEVEVARARGASESAQTIDLLVRKLDSLEKGISDVRASQTKPEDLQIRIGAQIASQEAEIEKRFATLLDKTAERLAASLDDRVRAVEDRKNLKHVEAAEVVLDSLFQVDDRLENNLSSVGVKQMKGGGIGGNLERLQSLLRGGAQGDEPKTEETEPTK